MIISIQVPCDGVFVVIFLKTMSNKAIIRFGFYDILKNQGVGKCCQPSRTLIIPDITKTSSNNCLIFAHDILTKKVAKRNVNRKKIH